jgi:Icc protein
MMMESISRRSFLAGSALAVGGWVLLPATGRAEGAVDPNRFVLMSDTHVCADRNAREHDCNPDEMIQQAVKDILELTPRPAGIIVSGDCVYLHGEKADYEALSEFLQPLRAAGIPLLLAMGNHDNRGNFQVVFSDAAILHGAVIEDRKAAVIETEHADWYLLDSLEKTDSTPGLFGGEQLAWLAGRLDKAPGKPALLVAHHTFRTAADDGGLKDSDAFLKVVVPRRQVKGYFFGHSHVWSLKRRDDGLHLVNLPANAWLFDDNQPRGFVDAQLQEGGCTLTLHCLNRADKRHGEKHRLDWRAV